MVKPTTAKTNVQDKLAASLKVKVTTEVIEAWKEAFRGTNERDIRLSDKTVGAVIERAGETWEGYSDDEKLEFLLKAEETASKIAVSDPGISNLVKRLENDAAAMQEVEEDIELAQRAKVTKVRLYAHFRRLYTLQELSSMPYPNTDKSTPWLGNYKPDTTVEPTNAGEIKVTWSEDFVSTMVKGKYYDERLSDLKAEESATNASKFYKGWSKSERNSEKSRLTGGRNALRQLVRGAIETHHCFEGIRGMALVNIDWMETKDTKNYIAMPEKCGTKGPVIQVTTAAKCIYIESKGDGRSGDVYSVGQLTAFDVQTAIKNGGTLAALKKTVEKAPKTKAGGALDYKGDGSDMDIDQFYTVTNLFSNYVNKTANAATTRTMMKDAKSEHRKDMAENFLTISGWINPLLKQFKKEIEELTQAKVEADTDEQDQEEAA